MKSIMVSSDVFAAIWKAHERGDDTEDAILRRILKLPLNQESEPHGPLGRPGGFYDERSGTHFPEGMSIFRMHKGHKVEAKAHLDRWFLPRSGKSFHSLYALSRHVNQTSNENAWVSWKFKDEHGNECLIDEWRKRMGQKR